MSNFDEGMVIRQLADFIHSMDIKPKHTLHIVADGQLHRFATDEDKGRECSGAYCLHMAGRIPAGYVQDWRKGIKETWTYSPTAEERREYGRAMHDPASRAEYEAEHRKAERQKAEAEIHQKENEARARAMAIREWTLGAVKPNDYGINEGYLFSSFGASTGIYIPDKGQFNRVYSRRYCITPIDEGLCQFGELLIPFVDPVTGSFKTLQRISMKPDSQGKYHKQFYKGIPYSGFAHAIIPENEDSRAVFLVEGYRTGLAVFVSVRGLFTVYVAGSCTTLLPVAEKLRVRYPERKIILVADNDASGAGENAAKKCKEAGVIDGYRMPEIVGHDWFDRLRAKTREQLKGAI